MKRIAVFALLFGIATAQAYGEDQAMKQAPTERMYNRTQSEESRRQAEQRTQQQREHRNPVEWAVTTPGRVVEAVF